MKRYIGIATLLLLAVGCGNEQDCFDPHNHNEICVNASLPGGSRATLTNFEAGDMISLYAVEYSGNEVAEIQSYGNYLNNEALTYNGEEWQGERALYWSANPCDFYGFYPYRHDVTMSNVIFQVAADQSVPTTNGVLGGYEASDLLWAKAEKVSMADGRVDLQFNHMLTRVVVNIERGATFEGELPSNIVVHIYNTATSAIVDWRIGSLEVYPEAGRKTITMRQIDGDSFDAIVVPQFIERSTPLIEVTMEGIAYLLESSISFRPGKQHTFTVTLNTSPDQEKIEISIDGEVGDWQ